MCYRDESGQLERLHCECGLLSNAPEWSSVEGAANELGPQCPECFAQYREVLSQEAPPEAAPEMRVTIDADGLVDEVRSRETQALTNEWLDLALRQEQLNNEFKEQKAAHTAALAKIKKRIGEIRGELQALKTGESQPVSTLKDESPAERQLRIQGT